jgi:hypothetical protein
LLWVIPRKESVFCLVQINFITNAKIYINLLNGCKVKLTDLKKKVLSILSFVEQNTVKAEFILKRQFALATFIHRLRKFLCTSSRRTDSNSALKIARDITTITHTIILGSGVYSSNIFTYVLKTGTLSVLTHHILEISSYIFT